MALLLRFADSNLACSAQQYVRTRQCRPDHRRCIWNYQSVFPRQTVISFKTTSWRHHEQRSISKFGWSRLSFNWYFHYSTVTGCFNRHLTVNSKGSQFLYENKELYLLEFPYPVLLGLLHRIQLRSGHRRYEIEWRTQGRCDFSADSDRAVCSCVVRCVFLAEN